MSALARPGPRAPRSTRTLSGMFGTGASAPALTVAEATEGCEGLSFGIVDDFFSDCSARSNIGVGMPGVSSFSC